jgi:uncharacterized protein (DUF169 family)
MPLKKEDLTILDQFAFETPPVGVKFLPRLPEGLERLGENAALCEMLAKAQAGAAFYADADNHTCGAGAYVLGLKDVAAPFINGEFGAGLKIFEEPRAAGRLYHYLPRIEKGVVNYVAFAPLSRLSFDPDVLCILSDIRRTEILLRAFSYRTGKPWVSRFSPAIGCAWTLVHPYLSGELNYFMTGMGHGMKRRNLFPEGRQVVSIPFDLLPSLLQTLQVMPWVLPAYEPGGSAFVGRLLERLGIPPHE